MIRNPFLGPQPYRAEDKGRFFGREDVCRKLANRILGDPFLTVFGPVGAGKTSVLQAGVIPLLEEVHDFRIVLIENWTASKIPLRKLALAMFHHLDLGLVPPGLEPQQALDLAVDLAEQRSERPILLCLDQFEQLLQHGQDEAQTLELLKRLQELARRPVRGLQIVLALREESLGTFRDLARGRRELLDQEFRLKPLTVAEMTKVVCKIAAAGSPPQQWSEGALRELMIQARVAGQAPTDRAEVQPAAAQAACQERWEKQLQAEAPSIQLRMARLQCKQGLWGVASMMLEGLSDPGNPDVELRLKAAFLLGDLCVHRNELERAQALAEQISEAARGRDGYFLALALCLRGMVAARRHDFSLAPSALQEALAHARQSSRGAQTKNLSARILLEEGIAHFLAREHDRAMQSFSLLDEEGGHGETYRLMRAEAERYRALIHSQQREFDRADGLLGQVLMIFQEERWHFLEYRAQKSRALNYLGWGRVEEAIAHLQVCQELLARDGENKYERAEIKGHLGRVSLSNGDAREALRWLEEEQELYAGMTGMEYEQARNHRNVARAHSLLGNTAEATRHFVRAVEGFQKSSHREARRLMLVELCEHRIQMSEKELAAADLVEAERSFAEAGLRQSFEPTLAILQARLARARGDNRAARNLYAGVLRQLAIAISGSSDLLAETFLYAGRFGAEFHDDDQAMWLFEQGSELAAERNLGYLRAQFRREIAKLEAFDKPTQQPTSTTRKHVS